MEEENSKVGGNEGQKGAESNENLESKADGYQKGLPFAEAIGENIEVYNEIVESDHKPILAFVEGTKIVSYNVDHDGSACGFFQSGFYQNNTEGSEPKEVQEKRHGKIVESLGKFVEKNEPDFIALQEIVAKEDKNNLYQKIKEKLGKDWDCVYLNGTPVDALGNITLYNTKKFLPAPFPPNTKFGQIKYDPLEGNKLTFHKVDNEAETISILNVHAPFAIKTDKHEESIRNFIQNNLSKTNVVVGDFNCTAAPLSDELQNVVTSVSPGKFDTVNVGKQGAYAIDAAFYGKRKNNGEVVCKQAEIQLLDGRTGKPHTKEDLKPRNIDDPTLTPHQRNEIIQLRMVMCVDDKLRARKLINGQTMFEYEAELRQRLSNKFILVRYASNLNNEKGMTISVDKDLFDFLAQDETLPFQFNKKARSGDNPTLTVCAYTKDVPKLVEAIDYYILVKILEGKTKLLEEKEIKQEAEIKPVKKPSDNSIGILNEDVEPNNFKSMCLEYLKALPKILAEEDIRVESKNKIIQHYVKVVEKLNKGEIKTIEDVKKLEQELLYKLHGKEPLSPKMTAVLSGIGSSLMGMVCLSVVMAFLTFGTSTALTTILLAIKISAPIVSVTGSLVGLKAGFKYGKKESDEYKGRKQLTDHLLLSGQLKNNRNL